MYSSQIICRISHITNFVVLISFSSLQNERHLLPLWIRLQFQKNRRAMTKMFLECRLSPSVLVSLPYWKRVLFRELNIEILEKKWNLPRIYHISLLQLRSGQRRCRVQHDANEIEGLIDLLVSRSDHELQSFQTIIMFYPASSGWILNSSQVSQSQPSGQCSIWSCWVQGKSWVAKSNASNLNKGTETLLRLHHYHLPNRQRRRRFGNRQPDVRGAWEVARRRLHSLAVLGLWSSMNSMPSPRSWLGSDSTHLSVKMLIIHYWFSRSHLHLQCNSLNKKT